MKNKNVLKKIFLIFLINVEVQGLLGWELRIGLKYYFILIT